MKMQILHVGKFFPPHKGGMETHLRQLVLGQAALADVEVLVAGTSKTRSIEMRDGAVVRRVPTFGSLASMPVTPTLPWELSLLRPDIVHVHTPNPMAAFSLALTRYRGPLVVTHHSDTLGRTILRRAVHPFVRRMMNNADRIIATSRRYQLSSPELRDYEDKVRVIPLGIEAASQSGIEDSRAAKIRASAGGKPVILGIGRLVPYKGFQYLIQAMASVDAKLLIIGSGPMKAELEGVAARSRVHEKVELIGEVDEIRPFYAMSELLVLPSISRAEAFGMVQLEAMMAGLPVINTDIDSGVPEVSLHEVTGLTVSPFDANALATAINRILRCPEMRNRMSDAARIRASTEFSVRRMVEKTMAVYEEVLGEHRIGRPTADL